MFSKILIANRGEIAVRIARTCQQLGIICVAVYSEADRDALHVRACDEAYFIGPAEAAESYLNAEKLIEVARTSGCEAVHPGYGFLSENPTFARAVIDAGLAWIGPSPEAMALMGSKIEAKRLAVHSGVPVVPGYSGDDQTARTLAHEAERIGFPVLIKASAGGGGKGMRVVEAPGEFHGALEAARREAKAAFGDGTLLLERYLADPRHIEVQVIGDQLGNIIHLGERECSIQRRHQKVFEEAPSPVVTPYLRERMTSSALALARAAGYTNAGTVEFIYEDGEYYFLEMNTRLQVEHPVTELATGVDLVELQIRIAAGEPLPLDQDDVALEEHAVEARLYAEDPTRDFLPSTGRITALDATHEPQGVRIDAGVSLMDTISPYYDPMIAKIIASGQTREAAVNRLRDVLSGLVIEGVVTNLDFLRWLVNHPQFQLGNLSTQFIPRYYRPGAFALAPVRVLAAAGALRTLFPSALQDRQPPDSLWHGGPWRLGRQRMSVQLLVENHPYSCYVSSIPSGDGRFHFEIKQGEDGVFEGEVRVGHRVAAQEGGFDGVAPSLQLQFGDERATYSLEYGAGLDADDFFVVWDDREYWIRLAPPVSTDRLHREVRLTGDDALESPMPGKLLKVMVSEGDTVEGNQPLLIVEAMKMEFAVRAPHAGRVARLHYSEGAQVAVGDVLVELEKAE